MTTPRRAAPRRPAVSGRVALGLGLYGVVAGLVLALDLHALLSASLALPAWAAFAVPPIVHALLAFTWLTRRGPLPIALATAVLVAGHWTLVAVTAAVEAFVDGASFPAAVAGAAWGAPLLFVVQLAIVPWSLLPLCRVLWPRSRGTAPSSAGPVPARGRPGAATPVATSPAVDQTDLQPAFRPAPGMVTGSTEPTVTPDVVPAVRGSVDAPAPPGPATSPRPAAERVEEMVRVRFERVAAQIPAAAFLLPLDRIAANLLEPDHLLVPQRMVAAQLAEGLVRVAWDVVADQFPRQALALPDADIARRIPGGALMLPLDEVVRQLPPDVFALTSPAADVRGIEDFPLPFQPHVPPTTAESDDGVSSQPNPVPLPPVEVRAAHVAGEPVRTHDVVEPPAVPVAASDAVVSDVIPPSVAPVAAPERTARPAEAEPDVPPHHHVRMEREVPPGPRPDREPRVEREHRPERENHSEREAWTEREPWPERPSRADVTPPAAEDLSPRSRPVNAAPTRRLSVAEVVAHLSPVLGSVDVDERYVAGLSVVVAAGPGIDVEAATATVGPILPSLADPRLPCGIVQATLRATLGSLVLTPLGIPERGSTVLVSAVAPGAPLAMVERAALRAVGGQEHAEDTSPAPRPGERMVDGDLRAAAVPANVRAVAESLRAFGRVTPAVLRDHAGTLLMYLFLPPDVDARLMAGYARDLRRHFGGGPLGTVSSFIARVGTQRLVVWELEAGRSCASVLVAFGAVDRPGLARIELERAALRLAAL
jgi:hypothetical protein